ncbi:exo-beta-N-acetylmuramidase NamZ family protein [Streptomyces sp. NPDC054933]
MAPLSRRGFIAATALGAGAASVADPANAAPGRDRLATGADVLAARGWRPLAGRSTGVLTNPTGVLYDLTHIVDAMTAAGARPVAAFGPEHGFRGTSQAGGSEGDYTDPRTGIPVYDAYGASAEQLAAMYRKAGVDTVVFDIAGVGARFYTYTWTMYVAMVAAVRTGAAFVVLDRPNPIGGQAYGPLLDPRFATGVGLKPVVQQPGMTAGELARMFDALFLPGDTGGRRLSSLDIVPVRGYRRDMLFTDTGLPWVPPSPNMPTGDTALLYPGMCMFEGTLLSEGRGTTRPFEMIGAPGIDWRWAEALNAMGLPGVRFRENYTVPTFDKFANTTCGGVQVHLTDRRQVDAISTAVAMMVTARRLYPSVFGWRPDHWIDDLTGSSRLRTMVDAGASTDEVVGAWRTELEHFRKRREPFLLYR